MLTPLSFGIAGFYWESLEEVDTVQVWPLDSDPRFTQRSDAKALSMHTHPQQVPSSITYVARPEP